MQGIDIEGILLKFRYPLLTLLLGLILIGFGTFYFKSGIGLPQTKVEVLNDTTESDSTSEITAEISGAVTNAGVYKLQNGSRVEDLLISAGGFSVDADRVWTDKYLNRAAKISDGEKVYIPKTGEQSNRLTANNSGDIKVDQQVLGLEQSGMININTASLKELDGLPGIGPTYGQSIIDHRPYSNSQELVSKGAIKQSVYEKIKDKVTVY